MNAFRNEQSPIGQCESMQSVEAAASAAGTVRVLHVINGEFYAGAERVQELLARRLPEFGYRASFVCLKQGRFQRQLEQNGEDAICLAMRSRLDVVRAAVGIARHARSSQCQLIHTHTPRGALVGALASVLSGLPMVHHVHSPTTRDSARAWLNRVNALVERTSLSRARALVPVSRSLADYLFEQGYGRDRVTTIQNGVAALEAQPDPRAADGPLVIGAVALFRPRKGIEVLLRALSRVVWQGDDVRLVVVGGFETEAYEASVRRLCRDLGLEDRIEWRGFREDVNAELARMDLLVLPSLFGEGMPMVVLEAMAAGLAIVATRVEGVPEVIRDGKEGLLVEPGDVGALADAIHAVAADRPSLEAMGAAGRQRQQTRYSDQAMAERLSLVYDGVLGRSRAQGSGTLVHRLGGTS